MLGVILFFALTAAIAALIDLKFKNMAISSSLALALSLVAFAIWTHVKVDKYNSEENHTDYINATCVAESIGVVECLCIKSHIVTDESSEIGYWEFIVETLSDPNFSSSNEAALKEQYRWIFDFQHCDLPHQH